MTARLLSPRELVSIGIARGWIMLPQPKVRKSFDNAKYMREWRQRRFYSRGLNHDGQPRKNVLHPDLAGLPPRDYMRLWQRWNRHLRRTKEVA